MIMKTTITTILALVFAMAVHAQATMKEKWSTKLNHQINFYGSDNAAIVGYGYASDGKELSMYDNETGKIIWTKKLKDIAPRLRKVDDFIAVWEADALFVLELKMGTEQVAVIDMKTGESLWFSDQYKLKNADMISYISEEKGFLFTFKDRNVFVDALTGAEKWSTAKFKGKIGAYYYKDGFLTTVNFIPSELLALFTGYKNQIAKINMKTGDIVWENTYTGRAERKVITGQYLYNIDVIDDHVVLQLNGLQLYDYNTGANLWSAAYDYEAPVKKPMTATSFGVYGAVPAPVFTDDYVYVLNMAGKRNQYINKYQRQTGKLVWQSQEISGGARAVPNMYVIDNKIILQIGGNVECQGVFKKRSGSGADEVITIEKRIYQENIKPNGVQAFSDEDGRLVWDSERFKKGITNMFLHGEDELIVSSGKALYNMNIQTGEVNYEAPVKNGGVGNALSILSYKDAIVVVGEKGVSTFNVSDGKLIAANKYKRASILAHYDNILVLETPTNDIAAFDLADKCKYRAYKPKKGSSSVLTTDGESVYVYEKKSISRLFTMTD